MKWHARHETGSAELDLQHKTLFESTEQFRQTLEAGAGERTYEMFLEFLAAYTEFHFAREEECMRIKSCSIAERNKKEHAGFTRLIEDETQRFLVDGFSHDSAMVLIEKIDQWLDSHICRIDTQLKNCAGSD